MSIAGQDATLLQNLTGHFSDVATCDFAPNFTLVTGSSDKTVRVWDWVAGSGYVERPDSPWKGHKYQVTCVRVSPQGSLLASASVDGTAILWNLHSGAKLYTMTQVNGDAIRVCRFAPDSSILVTAGDNGAICIWDLIHRSLIRTLFEHEGTTQSLAFTPDSQYMVSACSLEVIRVWYVQDLVDTTSDTSCSPLAKVDNAHDLGVFCIDISPTIQLDENNPLLKHYTMATCGNSNDIRIWTISSTSMPKHKSDTSNHVSLEMIDTYDGHVSSVTCVRYSKNGSYLISSSLDKLGKVWTTEGSCIMNLEGHTRYVNCVAISKDCTMIVTGSNDKLVKVWDITGNLTLDSELFSLRSAVGEFASILENQLSQNNETEGNSVKLLEKIDDIFEGAVNCCCFSNDNILATACGDKLVRLFTIMENNNFLEELSYSPLEGHTYAVNHVEFSSDGHLLASCSQDGGTVIWNVANGEKIMSVPRSTLSVKVCRFSPNADMLIIGGDEEKAVVWNIDSLQEIACLEGHTDAVTSAAFSPDGQLIVTTSFNSDYRLWSIEDFQNIYIREDAHNNGIQDCDFSCNLDPIPNADLNTQSYLLATCGNDSLGKLWRITASKNNDAVDLSNLTVKLWRTLQGHGGSVVCIRFSPTVGELVCSTATERQARIWSVYSAECLYVLDHDSIVTACSFSSDLTIVATGCLDKTLWLWRLPQQLVFRSTVANKIKCRTKDLVDWTTGDVLRWLRTIYFEEISQNVQNTSLDGQRILTLDEEQICSAMDLDDDQTERLKKELKWLKADQLHVVNKTNDESIPDEYLCPITREVMLDPVTCSDGFSYEKNAIAEWFMSGKYTSPMTNEVLLSTDYTHNQELRNAIHTFLDNIEG